MDPNHVGKEKHHDHRLVFHPMWSIQAPMKPPNPMVALSKMVAPQTMATWRIIGTDHPGISW